MLYFSVSYCLIICSFLTHVVQKILKFSFIPLLLQGPSIERLPNSLVKSSPAGVHLILALSKVRQPAAARSCTLRTAVFYSTLTSQVSLQHTNVFHINIHTIPIPIYFTFNPDLIRR